jgi:hypothetical protein
MNLAKRSLQATRRLAESQLSPAQALFTAMLLFGVLLCLVVLASRPDAWNASWDEISLFCHAWTQGDWLINYNGGFVRRGLAGSLLIPAAEWLENTPYAMVAGIQILGYMAVILMAIHLVRHPRPAPLALVLALISPATLLFQLKDIDRGRKEIALLAWAAVMAWRAARRNALPGKISLAITLLALTALHDGLFFFFPVLLLQMMALDPERSWSMKSLGQILAPALLLMAYTAWLGPTNERQFFRIVERFHGNPASWASSSIGYLGYGVVGAARHAFHDYLANRLAFMPATFLLASLPVWAWLAVDAKARGVISSLWQRPSAKALALTALLGQAALFVMTTDWGRWISIDLFLAALTLLSIQQREAPATPLRSSPSWLVFIAVLALYSGTWIMHPLCNTLFLSKPSLYLKLPDPPLLHATRMLP